MSGLLSPLIGYVGCHTINVLPMVTAGIQVPSVVYRPSFEVFKVEDGQRCIREQVSVYLPIGFIELSKIWVNFFVLIFVLLCSFGLVSPTLN
ncbi:hypothetical protein VTO73DRAFT_3259 [Trametes versicolor]